MKTGSIINIFPSCIAASRSIGFHQRVISDCCHGRRLQAGGYKWKFHRITLENDGKDTQGIFLLIVVMINYYC